MKSDMTGNRVLTAMVKRRLQKKYPQMYDESGKLKPEYAGKKAKLPKNRTEKVSSQLKGGLTQKEIDRLKGKK